MVYLSLFKCLHMKSRFFDIYIIFLEKHMEKFNEKICEKGEEILW